MNTVEQNGDARSPDETRGPRKLYSGVEEGETVGAAIRRQAAWIALAQRQRKEGGDEEAADREIREALDFLMTISLEADELALDLALAKSTVREAPARAQRSGA